MFTTIRAKGLNGDLRCAPGNTLNKAETLQEIRRAEAEIREEKEVASRERERIVREARKEALDLQGRLRTEAEGRAAAVVRDADAATAKEREAILAKGGREAEAVRAAGMANVDRAVEVVLRKFQGALDA